MLYRKAETRSEYCAIKIISACAVVIDIWPDYMLS